MKKREPKVDPTNNIILNDKELEVLIRQLVKKAHQKGARMSWLNKAISTIWKEEFPVEKEEYKLTAEEEVFAKKAENFLKHYEPILVSLHDKGVTDRRFVIEGGEPQLRKNFFNKYYQILCAMYAVFEKEDRISIIQITRVVRQYFGYKITITKEEIDFLYYFLYTGLSFDDTDEIPEYSDRFQRNKHRIASEKSFKEFEQQYETSHHRIYDTSFAAIWLIEKYF